MKLTPHEEKILQIIRSNPEVLANPEKRESIAKTYGLSEKTLRNSIAELKKRGLIKLDGSKQQLEKKSLLTDDNELNILELWERLKLKKKFISFTSLTSTVIG